MDSIPKRVFLNIYLLKSLNSERNETINKIKNKYKETIGNLQSKIDENNSLIQRLCSEKEEQKIKWEESLNLVDEKMRECEEKAGKLEEERNRQIVSKE